MHVPSSDEIQADVTALIEQAARDWDHAGAIGPDTRLFADPGFESLDAVILGTAVQERCLDIAPTMQGRSLMVKVTAHAVE